MLHRDRVRAESFGAAAEQYDRFRPAYPDALIDDLAALRPTQVLDVGCGTGKVAVALQQRGLSVLGLDPDARMAEVARAHGVDVQVATFETWNPAGRRFDLVTCGDAWHWLDPDRAPVKAAEVLRPGGILARCWTITTLAEPAVTAFDPIYRAHAPEITQVWRPDQTPPTRAALLPGFAPARQRAYPWDRSLSTTQWLGLVATVSDHRRLGPDRLQALLHALGTAIDKLGGTVHTRNETHTLLSRRA